MRVPYGKRDAKLHEGVLFQLVTPARLANSRISDLYNPASCKRLRTPSSLRAFTPGR